MQGEPIGAEFGGVQHLAQDLHQMTPRFLHHAQQPGLLRVEWRGLKQLTRTEHRAQRGLELMAEIGQK